MGSEQVVVYGAGDDIISVSGGLTAEHGVYGEAEGGIHLGLSCGVLLHIQYDGDWTIRFDQELPDDMDGEILNANTHDHEYAPGYSDVAVIEAESIDWAVLGNEVSE